MQIKAASSQSFPLSLDSLPCSTTLGQTHLHRVSIATAKWLIQPLNTNNNKSTDYIIIYQTNTTSLFPKLFWTISLVWPYSRGALTLDKAQTCGVSLHKKEMLKTSCIYDGRFHRGQSEWHSWEDCNVSEAFSVAFPKTSLAGQGFNSPWSSTFSSKPGEPDTLTLRDTIVNF